MGTGSSKSKNSRSKNEVVVAAEVVIPGQSQPAKVTGHVVLDDNGQTNDESRVTTWLSSGEGQVKKLAPNKYSLQMGDGRVGTFNVSAGGDFETYLATASQLTITNIQEGGETSIPQEIQTPMQIKLNQQVTQPVDNYRDDEDWEEVIKYIDDQSTLVTTSDDAMDGGNDSGRKTKLKMAFKRKQAKLSQDEYQQMIANHKQEVELMNLLREKEKDRQKCSLASKVAQRKRRRMARNVEREGQNLDQGTEETERLQVLQTELEKTESQFQVEMTSKSKIMTDAESAVIMVTHKRKMAELQEEMKAEQERCRLSLADKLAERKERRLNIKAEKEEQKKLKEQNQQMIPEEIHELELTLEQRQVQFEAELHDNRHQLSKEEYKLMIETHKEELTKLREKLDLQREQRRQMLLEKLYARIANKGSIQQDLDPLSADDIQELQLILNQMNHDFKMQLKEARQSKKTQIECQAMIDEHKAGMEELQRQLEQEKKRMRDALMVELEARAMEADARSPMSQEEIKQLQLVMDSIEADFQEELNAKKGKVSEKEFQALINQHEKDTERQKILLRTEKMQMEQILKDKLTARRHYRLPTTYATVGSEMDSETNQQLDIEQLHQMGQDLKHYKTQLEKDQREMHPLLSDEEYRQLIESHKQEMESLQEKLELQRRKQHQALLDKLAGRRTKRGGKMEELKPLSSNEVKELQLALNQKAIDFRQQIAEAKKSKSFEEVQKIIDAHHKEMEMIQQQLDQERLRMQADLMAKLEARRQRKNAQVGHHPKPLSSNEVKELQLALNQKAIDFRQQIAEAKKSKSFEEVQKIIDAHHKEMEMIQQQLDQERLRMQADLMAKLEARRQRKNAQVGHHPKPLSSNEVKELQLALNQKAIDFRQQIAEAEKSKSFEEVQKIIDAHHKEMEMIQQQLDQERLRMQADLMAKLEARRQRKNAQNSEDELAMSAEDIKQLQLLIDKKEVAFKEEQRAKKGKVSDEDYQQIINRHDIEMEGLQKMLDREKLRMEQTLKDKLATRRKRSSEASWTKEDEANAEVTDLERAIEIKMANLIQDAKHLRPLLSNEEYDQLLTQHKKELQDLKTQLDAAMRKQKQSFEDKLVVRRLRRKRLQEEAEEKKRLLEILDNDKDRLSEEDFKELEEDINHYNTMVTTKLHSKQGKISKAQYDQLINDHKYTMDTFYSNLNRQRQRMEMVLSDKLAARRLRTQTYDDSSDDDSDQDSSEDEDEFGDIPDPKLVCASTQLWTTPTQSSVLAVVPLREEYPIRRREQLYTDPAIFKHLDAHAIRLAQTASLITIKSFSSLVIELTRVGSTELDKVRLIFRWITAQNCDEMDLADAVDDTPLGVLKGLYYTKITFSTLFMRMCRFVGLNCVEICGWAKKKGYQPGQAITLKDRSYAHTWNAVRIDNYWHVVDCNWGVSHIPGSVTFDPFRFEYDEHYFLIDPNVIIKTHFPNDPSWQLLMQPITLEQFTEAVPLKPDFFKFGFELLNHQRAVIEAPTGDLDVRLGSPAGFILFCKLSTVEGGREVSLCGIHFSQYVFIHQIAENVMACYIRIPEPGHYYATFYAKRQFLEGALNLESQTEVCRYYVKSHAPSSDQEPLPRSPADHWGPVGVSNAGLTPITNQSGVIIGQDGNDIDIRFKKTRDLKFTHYMTGNSMHEIQLAPYSIQREVNQEIVFTLCLPRIGRYGLHIYTIYPGRHNPIYLCSYLIVMRVVKPIVNPIPQPPTGELYGPSRALLNFGVSTFTHPDPFIRTCDDQVQIVFGLSKNVNLNHNFIYNPPSCVDLSRSVKYQSDGGSVIYHLYLSQPGYYHFRLEGKHKDAPEIPNVQLYNYVIRKD